MPFCDEVPSGVSFRVTAGAVATFDGVVFGVTTVCACCPCCLAGATVCSSSTVAIYFPQMTEDNTAPAPAVSPVKIGDAITAVFIAGKAGAKNGKKGDKA